MKKDRKILKSLLASVLTLALVLSLAGTVVPAAHAEKSSSEIQKEIDAMKAERAEIQKEIDALQSQMSGKMDSMEEVVAQKDLIDQEIFLLHEQIANTNAQIMAYSVMIADKQAELDSAQSRLTTLQQKNKARIRAMEKNSQTSYWSVVFKATSFLDMLDRLNTMYKINKADQELIAELSKAADEVSRVKGELQEQKVGLEQTKKELEVTQEALESKRLEADAVLAELVSQYQEYERFVADAEQTKNQLNQELGTLEQQYQNAKDREYQKWYEEYINSQPKPESGNTETGNTVGGITWLKPCSYTRVSSPYGWRDPHPVYGDRRFHAGIDLAAPAGTPIYATRSGKVSVATYSSSAGYYVNIDHGDGYMSRYLHMTHYVVSAGQKVSAGQLLGYVGSTGTSTGPHLHFSLYKNGSTVNPADYIKF